MKKILIIVASVLFLALAILVISQGITLGKNFTVNSVSELKNLKESLDKEIQVAKELKISNYPEAEDNLEESIVNFKTIKEKYDDKILALEKAGELGITYLGTYKYEYLLIKIDSYAQKRKLDLTMDVMKNESGYSLAFNLIGNYSDITNFLYDIENDDTLGFEISDLKLSAYKETVAETIQKDNKEITQEIYPYEYSITTKITSPTNEEETATTYEPKKIEANFTVENININF